MSEKKMSNRFNQIGLDRLVRLEWLEKTTSYVIAGLESNDIRNILKNDLIPFFRSNNPNVRGSIDKTVTILLKVWLRVPTELENLRLKGLELIKQNPQQSHIVNHWGMLMATYPFWSAVAVQVGRLLKLQGDVKGSLIQRRIREQYGERETVSRRVRYILRSFLDWGVLHETDIKGEYRTGFSTDVDEIQLVAWLIEASLHSRSSGSASLMDLLESPCFFPFKIKHLLSGSFLSSSSSIEIIRHGLDKEMVILKK
ncbi:hypothetical protein ACFLRW_02190 [Acidobacteriota bacterium]